MTSEDHESSSFDPHLFLKEFSAGEPYKYKSLYAGYAEAKRLGIVGAKREAREPSATAAPPYSKGIPFTLLLNDLMPGESLTAQVKKWNQVTGELHSEETAAAYMLPDQRFVSIDREKWENGQERPKRSKRNAPVTQPQPEPMAASEINQSATVSLRDLLPKLYSGTRRWSEWLKRYNQAMETNHQSSRDEVSLEEANKARAAVPLLNKHAQRVGRKAGGAAGLKNQKAAAMRDPNTFGRKR